MPTFYFYKLTKLFLAEVSVYNNVFTRSREIVQYPYFPNEILDKPCLIIHA